MNSYKFKAGDKVICIDNTLCPDLTVDAEYTVMYAVYIANELVYLTEILPPIPNGYYAHRFRKYAAIAEVKQRKKILI